jgi:integrase
VGAGQKGDAYKPNSFSTMFRKLIKRALKETDLIEPFRFHDIRVKSASDDTLEAASERLGHTSKATTERFYRRKPNRVRPLTR